jgi:ABC-2 type transport system permease protein
VTTLLRTELVKAVIRTRTYVVYALMVLIPALITYATYSNPPEAGRRFGGGGGPAEGLRVLATGSGLIMGATSLRIMSAFFLVIVLALFGGDAIAGEASWGNLRYLLIRPITRFRLAVAKFAVAVACGWLAIVLVVVVGVVAGGIAFGFHGLAFTGLGPFAQALSESGGQIIARLALASVYVAWTLTPILAFAFLISCMTDAPAGAVFAGLGLYITATIVDGIDSIPFVIRESLPTHYNDRWTTMFTENHVSVDLRAGALLALVYIGVLLAIALWYFKRKDITS